MAKNAVFGQPEFRNLRGWVLGEITNRIIRGEFPPGSRINETELAAQLGLSRPPVREALRQLERDGFVVTQPNASTYVTPLSRKEFEQLYEIRSSLEPLMTRYAVQNADETEIEDVLKPIMQMREALETGSPEALVDLDVQFHLALYVCAKREKLRSILNGILQQSRRYMMITTHARIYEGWSACSAEHFRVYEAIRNRAAQEAEAAIQDHLSRGSARMLNMLSIYTTTEP